MQKAEYLKNVAKIIEVKFARCLAAFLCVQVLIIPSAFAATHSHKGSIKEIGDAGVYCEKDFGKDFYKRVAKLCVGKDTCNVKPTLAGSRKELKAHQCTGFFVAPLCNDSAEPVNFESKGLSPLLVSCLGK